jgi:hypothetical protein
MSGESWDEVLEKSRRGPVPASEKVVSLHAVEGDPLLPGDGDPYKAAGMQSTGSLTRLCCIMGREGFQPGGKAYRFFQYVHLDSDTDFGFTKEGQVVTLRFAGLHPVVVIVRGRNLLRICDYIHLHRLPWIRVADRDFAEGSKEIITSIDIAESRTGELR